MYEFFEIKNSKDEQVALVRFTKTSVHTKLARGNWASRKDIKKAWKANFNEATEFLEMVDCAKLLHATTLERIVSLGYVVVGWYDGQCENEPLYFSGNEARGMLSWHK